MSTGLGGVLCSKGVDFLGGSPPTAKTMLLTMKAFGGKTEERRNPESIYTVLTFIKINGVR